MNQVGDCEHNHLQSDFQLMEELLGSILQIIRVNKNKVSVTISEYKLGSVVSLDAYQKLQKLSAKSIVEMESVSQNVLNYKEINTSYWNRTDHYFDKGWMNQKIKLEEALNIIRLETVEHGSLDTLSLIKQYGHGSENYRLMALIKLAQLSQGTYSTKENITKVEEEDWTKKVLTGLKEAKDNAGEFLESTGKFLLSQLPESFTDIVMFCGGFSDRVLTNIFPGSNFMNEPYQETLLIPYTKGAIAGDIVSMVAGVLMSIVGGSMVVTGGLGVVAGTAVVATGVGAVPGVAIDGASVGLIIEGVAVAVVGVELTLSASKNIVNDLQKLQEAKNSVDSEIENGSDTKLPENRRIDKKVLKDLKQMGLDKKFQNANEKGLAPRREGTSGIIKLSENEIISKGGKTYTYKLKVPTAGGHTRVYGYIDDSGELVFDLLIKK